MYAPAVLGLQPSEEVLRGGHLREPIVLTRLKRVEGRSFLCLWKTCRELVNFLASPSTRQRGKRPLANTNVFEELQVLRQQARQRILDDAMVDCGLAPPKQEEDLASKLDLDDDNASASTPKTKRSKSTSSFSNAAWRLERKERRVLPKIVAVTLERTGFEPWTVNLLLERDNMAPAMECTAKNFAKLFELVDHDLANGDHHRQRYGADVASRPAPRGPSEARSYYVRNHWITKIRLQGDDAREQTDTPRKRYRTLKRRSSRDEPPLRRPKRKLNVSSAAAATAPPLGDGMNMLDLDL